MTQHNKDVEEIKDRCSHVKIWTENNYYYPEDVFIAEIKQAQAREAAKLAEELLGSDEMRLKNYPHQDATQDREIKSHNKSISAIKAKIESLLK